MEKNQRLPHIDFIRGFALFGILLINVQTFTLHFFLPEHMVYSMGLERPETYRPLRFLTSWLVQGQFYPVYSFLFGLGFWFLLNKYKNAENNFGKRLFKRRLWLLLIMGLIHGLVFWFGDILHNYAILGFTLLYFNKKSFRTIWKWILGLALFYLVFQSIKYGFFLSESDMLQQRTEMEPMLQKVAETYSHGTFFEIMRMQGFVMMLAFMMDITNGLAISIPIQIMFLLGLMAGKAKVFFRIEELKPRFKKLLYILLIPALAIKAIACLNYFDIRITESLVWNEFIERTSLFVGMLLLAVCYMILFLLLFKENLITKAIANTGRFGLTNYLTQTLVFVLLFYPYAIGLSGKTPLWLGLLIVCAIYLVQVVISNIYIRYSTIGPMEKLWRNLALKLTKHKISELEVKKPIKSLSDF